MTTLTAHRSSLPVYPPPPTSEPEVRREDVGEPALSRSAFLRHLSDDVAHGLALEFESFELDRGSTVFIEGDRAEYVYVVLSGKVKLIKHAHDGRERLVELLGPSDHFGEVAVLDSTPRSTTAMVVTDARLARLSKTALHGWIARHPQLATQLLRLVAHRLRRTHTNLSNLVFIDTSGRVARALLHLAQRFGVRYHDEVHIEHDLSQTELAQLVGSSRETVNKVLSRYAARGWVRLELKSIVILDHDQLVRRAYVQSMPTHSVSG